MTTRPAVDRDVRPENVGHQDQPPLRRSAESHEDALRAYVEERRARMEIVATTRTPSGQVVDWIPRDSQVGRGERLADPPPLPAEARRTDPAHPTAPVLFELEEEGAEHGPEGTVPVLRKELDRIDGTQSVARLIGKYPDAGRQYVIDGRLQSPPAPITPGPHRYANTSQAVIAFGGEGILSAFAPYTENSDDFSLLQISCSNSDLGYLQTVEAGWQVRKDSYGDWLPHLFTYYTTNGYRSDGDNKGGYNEDVDGWKQHDDRVHPGALSSPTSVKGGAQYELSIKYQWFNGNWWLMCNGRWLGYYPSSLFMGSASTFSTLGDHADHISFYGEIYDSNVVAGKTKSDMGSGSWPEAGWQWSAYERNLRIQTDRAGTMADYDGGGGWASDSDMYRLQTHMRSGGTWGSYMWLGGPGAG